MQIHDHERAIPRLWMAGAITAGALLLAGTARAETTTDAPRAVTVIQYQLDLDAEQRKLDRLQADLDRQQAALDRRKRRWRSSLEDASWRFRMLDADNDGLVSDREANSMPVADRMFETLDDNDDGELTAEEFADISVHTTGAPFAVQ